MFEGCRQPVVQFPICSCVLVLQVWLIHNYCLKQVNFILLFIKLSVCCTFRNNVCVLFYPDITEGGFVKFFIKSICFLTTRSRKPTNNYADISNNHNDILVFPKVYKTVQFRYRVETINSFYILAQSPLELEKTGVDI